ncbi:DNA mismatch repair protein Msh2 [Phytophthora citrophthora]|uniref:DNA mismatch repair protein Msh2 n=1 Tax=Phytophthora citrophthora TaxID=4793 RepID=A0AAD9GVP9_9STRA|nr:DNA mismatch repair protein Msh2 [Phytophthora citrophthora]
MQLNKAAKEVFVSTTGSTTRFPSLFNLLGPSCSTKRGRQCLKQVLRARLDTVEALVTAIVDENPSLRRLSSLFQHVQAHERELLLFTTPEPGTMTNSTDTKLSLQDFRGLLQWLRELQLLVGSCLVDAELSLELANLFSTRLVPIQQLCSSDLEPLCLLIQETLAGLEEKDQNSMEIDSESETKISTSHLRELRSQIRQCEVEVTVATKQAATLLCIAEDRIKIVYAEDDQSSVAKMGIVLRVSRQDSHRIQQQSKGNFSIIRASRASGVWFSTPAIDSLGAKWKSLKQNYQDAEATLVEFLTLEFQSHFQRFLDELTVRVAELDVLVSFALVSHKHKLVRALASDNCFTFQLCGIFDPFTDESYSEMTIDLSERKEKTFLLLEGNQQPNRTSILQLLGIVVVLNQIGCFVPCREAKLPVFDAIYLRTGAYDQQLYGYSTFMTEMRDMSHIFSTMTPNSLVLIEDLCRGTSTSEGLALALSLCLHLMETKTPTCFSSKWNELTKELAKQPSTATPLDNNNPSRNVQDPVRSFDKLMLDCDLPADLISLVQEEIQNK